MKKLMRVFCIILAVGLFTNLFTSCKKDVITEPAPTEETTENNTDTQNGIVSEEVGKMMTLGSGMSTDSSEFCGCFDIFGDIDWDASEAEIIAQLEAILDNLTEEELEELFTPVCTPDGEEYINACVAECDGVTDYIECDFDDEEELGWEECFEFVYPMDVVFPGGATQTVNSDEELITAVEDWYDANPNSNEDPTLAFPVNVLLEGETDPTPINDLDELEDLIDDCHDDDYEECFTFVFPLTIQFPDESTVEINSIDEGEDVIEAWYDANPNTTDDVTLVFPIQVTLDDGTIETINNEEELEDLYEECEDDMGGCFIYDDSKKALAKTTAKLKKAN